MLEALLHTGFVRSGCDVELLGVMPTPAIATLTRKSDASLGVAISASHNPFHDNGIKFFDDEGLKLSDESEWCIENLMHRPFNLAKAGRPGRSLSSRSAGERYVDFCVASTDGRLDLRGLHVVLDCANGANHLIAPQVFSRFGAKLDLIGSLPDGRNINLDCGSTRPARLQSEVVRLDADVGIAFDGDGDRVVMVDKKGRLLHGDQLLYALAKSSRQRNEEIGGVVGTVMSNLGLEVALEELGIQFCRAEVGDRYVYSKMVELNWFLGGESSGHIVCSRHTNTGDGIITALQVLVACQEVDCTVGDVFDELQLYPQVLVNVEIPEQHKPLACKAIHAHVATLDPKIQECNRIIVRPSGTEPVVRVMVEGKDEAVITDIAHRCAEAVNVVK